MEALKHAARKKPIHILGQRRRLKYDGRFSLCLEPIQYAMMDQKPFPFEYRQDDVSTSRLSSQMK
jgi:hypothetical protein